MLSPFENTMINYSIIIPHKNIPHLLQRCLDSIPVRDDIQVIIVDDNSNPDIVDFNSFPGFDRDNVECIFNKESRGAGYARNKGIDLARGEWLIFVDSDDFFSANINSILDEYIESDADLLFFDYKTVYSDDITQLSDRSNIYHTYIEKYISDGSAEYELRYCFYPIWGKIIRRSFVDFYRIRCSEVRWSNDVYFSLLVGFYAHKMHVSNKILFVITQRGNSLTNASCKTNEELHTRLSEALKSECFLKKNSIEVKKKESLFYLRILYQMNGLKWFLKDCFAQPPFSLTFNSMCRYLGLIFVEKFKLLIGL